ncbi:actin-like ATPase domain-containing protein [Suillus weaverae]|nr:actin-like ATPase domain-containing protein [Suillus weaverae]
MVSFRDSSVVIIESGRTLIRAGVGLQDLLKAPSVEIQARVGLRRNPGDSANGASSQTLKPGESNDNLRPSASSSRASSLPFQPSPSAKVHDYLVGSQLDEAVEAGQDITVSWPFADGDVRDWTQAEALWKYVLFRTLQLKRTQNESPVMLSMPAGLYRDSSERICQIFFERFNVAGFGLLDRPMAQLYAAGQLHGVVVDIGHEITDITPIYDGFILQNARSSTPLGIRDCQVYLANLLRSNQSVMAAASPPDKPSDPEVTQRFLDDLVKYVWTEGLVRVPSDGQTVEIPEDEGVTDIATVLVAGCFCCRASSRRKIKALDLVTAEFRERWAKSVIILELPLQETVVFSVRQMDVTQSRLVLFILSTPDQATEVQPRSIRVLTVPEYFAEYREKGDGFAAFLGTSIVAKIAFNESHGKNFVSKTDYNEKGPHAVLEMSLASL